MKRLIAICVMGVTLIEPVQLGEADWTILDPPDGWGSWAYDIDGGDILVVGSDSAGGSIFLYDGTTWTTQVTPGDYSSQPSGIDNARIVGTYRDFYNDYHHGYISSGQSWTPVDAEEDGSTYLYGIDGGDIIGYFVTYTGRRERYAFIYSGGAFTRLIAPGAYETVPRGIDNGKIVGFQHVDGDWSSFLYDGGTWTTLNAPGALRTWAYGIDGDNIVGMYYDFTGQHGFLYNGSTWTTLDAPGASHTWAYGIDGNNIVGHYNESNGHQHAFLFTFSPPVADGDGPYEIYAGADLGLDASGSTDDDGDIDSYMWDLDNDGTFETDAGNQPVRTVSYAYLESLGLIADDTYTISLRVTDSDALSAVAESTLTILPAFPVSIDILPGVCRNPLNVKSKGDLSVAILGTDTFDVDYIDVTEVTLAGVHPILERTRYKDVSTPVGEGSDDCECNADGKDGFDDLVLYFDNQTIVEVVGYLDAGEEVSLILEGALWNGVRIEGSDCVVGALPKVSIIKAKMVKIPPTFTKIGLGVDLSVKFLDSDDPSNRRYVFLEAVLNGQSINKGFDVSGLVAAGEEKDILWNDGQFTGQPLIVLDLEAAGVPRFEANEKFELTAYAYSSDFIFDGIMADPDTKSVEVYLPVVIVHGYLFPDPKSRTVGRIILPAVYDSLANYLHTKDPNVNDPDKGPFITGYTADVSPYQTIWRNNWQVSWTPGQVSDGLHELIDEVRGATHANRVNIVGHSMGGLIGRYYACDADGLHPESPNRVHKLVTIGTPHWGVSKFYEVSSGWSAEKVRDFGREEPLALWGFPRYEDGSGTPITCIYQPNTPNDKPLWPDLSAIVRLPSGFSYPEQFPDQVAPPPGVAYFSVFSAQHATPYLLYAEPNDHKGETWYRVMDPVKEFADGDGLVTQGSAQLPIPNSNSIAVEAEEKHGFLPMDPKIQKKVLSILID